MSAEMLANNASWEWVKGEVNYQPLWHLSSMYLFEMYVFVVGITSSANVGARVIHVRQ